MKPINIIKRLNESAGRTTDWKALKAGLSSCKTADDLQELMIGTMSVGDYSQHCDYVYEVEDSSTLSWAKKELRKLADENLKGLNDHADERKSLEKINKIICDEIEDRNLKIVSNSGVRYNTDENDNIVGFDFCIVAERSTADLYYFFDAGKINGTIDIANKRKYFEDATLSEVEEYLYKTYLARR